MLDGGKGMIETLNAVPVTHMCFGNHENDVPLQQLVSRCGEYEGKWINSNMYDEVVGRELVCVCGGEGHRLVQKKRVLRRSIEWVSVSWYAHRRVFTQFQCTRVHSYVYTRAETRVVSRRSSVKS